MVVHSLKDLPSTLPENMVIGAIMERLDPRDVVIMKKKVKKDDDPMTKDDEEEPKELSDLRKGSILGTSAVRRGAQLRAAFPDLGIIGLDVFDDGYICSVIVESIFNTTHLLILEFQDIRGNLNTRFRKLDADDGPYSAIILAAAGVKRLGWENRISSYLHQKVCLHAVGQGALAIECRKQDWYMINVG